MVSVLREFGQGFWGWLNPKLVGDQLPNLQPQCNGRSLNNDQYDGPFESPQNGVRLYCLLEHRSLYKEQNLNPEPSTSLLAGLVEGPDERFEGPHLQL